MTKRREMHLRIVAAVGVRSGDDPAGSGRRSSAPAPCLSPAPPTSPVRWCRAAAGVGGRPSGLAASPPSLLRDGSSGAVLEISPRSATGSAGKAAQLQTRLMLV